MPEAIRHVFVYGTLRKGGRNDINRLAPAPKYLGVGEVEGCLYPLGWYPGLALGGERAVRVVGEVYEVTRELEAVLDAIEGVVPGEAGEYAKRELEVPVGAGPCAASSMRSIPSAWPVASRSPTATGSGFTHREKRFAWRNRAMLRRAKISRYKKRFPVSRKAHDKWLNRNGNIFVFYKTQEPQRLF